MDEYGFGTRCDVIIVCDMVVTIRELRNESYYGDSEKIMRNRNFER